MASSKSKSRDSEKKDKSAKSKKVSKKSPAPAAYKSEEFVQDSDEEEDENEKSADEDSDEGSDSDESVSSAKPTKSSTKANGKLPPPVGSSSSSEGESAESEESEDEEDSEGVTKEAPVVIEPTKKPAKQATTNTVSFKAPAPYQPPPGFDLASLDGTSKASQMLKRSNLEGKQIWYFTAPASVPIASLKAMSLLDAKNGKTILSYEGNDYGFIRDSAEDTTYTKIMVPSSDAGYKASSKSIDQVFHLQQVAQDPTTANRGRATKPAKKPIRQQPRGLKMRFHPIGFGATEPGTIGSSSSDEEMDDAPSRTRRPVSKSKSATNSGEAPDSDVEMVDGPALPSRPHPDIERSSPDVTSKKEKKRKHSEGGDKKSKHKKADRISEKAGKQSISVN